jgi:hypothetical protein
MAEGLVMAEGLLMAETGQTLPAYVNDAALLGEP